MIYYGGYEKSAPYYDIFDTKQNIDFFCRIAKKASEILDIGAGTGRIAIPIAKKGVKVYCVEPSLSMITEFEKKLSVDPSIGENITLVQDEARSFNFRRTFPTVFLSGTFDHFLTDKERLAVLKNINRHLDIGGMLIFDIFLGLMKDSQLHPAGQVKEGIKEHRRFIKSTVCPENRIKILLVYETYEAGKLIQRIEQESQAGVVSRQQVHRLLNKTGFDVKTEYGDYDFSNFKEGNELLIIEAIKKG